MNNQDRASNYAPRERNFVERVLYTLLGLTILVLAFFFLTVALIAGAFLAAIIAVRWWWMARKLRQSASEGTIEGEYTIVEHPVQKQTTLPPER
jgi:predicted membrane metal-binding protein